MSKFLHFYLLFIFALIASCSHVEDNVKPNPGTINPLNQPPSVFSVDVETGANYAVISWGRVKDSDLDTVYLEVFLGDSLVSPELKSDTSFTIRNLTSLQDYQGYVQATDKKSVPIKVTFSFRTKSEIRVFNRLYPGMAGGEDMILCEDGGFVSAMGLNKYDSLGNIIFYQHIDPPSYGPMYTDLIQSSDGGYLFCNRFEIQKFDNHGSFLWKSGQAGDTLDYYTVYNSIAELPDGGYLAVGNNVKDGGIIQKFNSLGKQVWRKHYEIGAAETMVNCTSITKALDGGYVITGSSGASLEILVISKIDSEGEISWIKNYSNGNYVADAEVLQASDGSFIVGANTMRIDDSYESRVVNVSATGEMIWDKIFFLDNDDTQLYSIIELGNGDYLFVGSQGYYQKSALLVKLSHAGDLILKKEYYPNEIDYQWMFTAVRQTKDGGFIMMGGKGFIYNGTESGSWLLKTDIEGNF